MWQRREALQQTVSVVYSFYSRNWFKKKSHESLIGAFLIDQGRSLFVASNLNQHAFKLSDSKLSRKISHILSNQGPPKIVRLIHVRFISQKSGVFQNLEKKTGILLFITSFALTTTIRDRQFFSHRFCTLMPTIESASIASFFLSTMFLCILVFIHYTAQNAPNLVQIWFNTRCKLE